MSRQWCGLLLVLLVFGISLACRPSANAPVVARAVPSSGESFMAAATTADITPPLHLSLFGHGPESRIATGVRLRLRCEVFVIASKGEAVALIPCDLPAPSMALQRKVAERVGSMGVPLRPERIFIMATHTHAGPAHYFEARRYSGAFSSSLPGYDPHVLDFLATRISDGIVQAFSSLSPACVGWNQRDLRGFTFNRSYVPFLANPETGALDDPVTRAKKAENAARGFAPVRGVGGDAGAEPIVTGPEAAVDSKLTVLRIDRRENGATTCASGSTMGVLAVYGMHPTGIPNTNELYHGDIFGFAVRTAEACLGAGAIDAGVVPPCDRVPRPLDGNIVVGLANGIEGDVSPKLDFQSVPEARELGRALGMEIVQLVQGVPAMRASGIVKSAYWELSFPGGHSDDDPKYDLCATGELGMAAAGGARDGPTRLRVIPEANAGFKPPEPSGCHGFKLPLRAGMPSPYDLPVTGPIGLIQVGQALFATAPGEMTTMTGLRVRQAIEAELDPTHTGPRVPVVGLTNQYLQYFATREEYDFQYYEGASTLYGPYSSKFLVRHFACLAKAFAGRSYACTAQPRIDASLPFDSDPAPVVNRWPAEQDVEFVHAERVPAPSRRSRDGALGWEMTFEKLPLTFTSDRDRFSVQVLAEPTGIPVDDDRGSSIEVREIEGDRWRVRWIPDLGNACDPRCGRSFRIAIRGRVQFESPPFTLDCGRCAQ